jgi:uncharacterized RDD family membrane protein YckC
MEESQAMLAAAPAGIQMGESIAVTPPTFDNAPFQPVHGNELTGIGFMRRTWSYLLDFAILSGAVAIITPGVVYGLGPQFRTPNDPTLFGWVLNATVLVAYFTLFEWLFGATPGKALTRLRVVQVDGTPCTFSAALTRSLARLIDGLLFGVLAAISMRAPLHQRGGDMLARTLVVSSKASGIRRHHAWWWFGLAAVCAPVLLAAILTVAFAWFA